MADMIHRAQHEFGHYIVGRAMGFETGQVSAEITSAAGGSAEIITSRPLENIPDVEQFCEDRIKVLYAGVLAETLEDGMVDVDAAIKLAHTTGIVDNRMVQNLCNLLRNIRYPNESEESAEYKMQEDEIRLWNETAELVERYGCAIQTLAKDLYERRSVHGKPATMTGRELRAHPVILEHFPSANDVAYDAR